MYKASVFIHIASALFWVGGMLFTVLVLVPASRHSMFKHKRGKLFEVVGKKFSKLSWLAFIILILTGITNLLLRGYTFQDLISTDFWYTDFGGILAWKLGVFAIILIISGIHDFYAGPRASHLMDQSPEAAETRSIRKTSSWLGRLNLLFGLWILYLAISLIRG